MILTSTFIAALKFVAHAAAKKDIRTYLMGVLFQFKGNLLHLVATDGYSLATVTLELSESVAYDADVIVPNEAVQQILKSCAKDKGATCFYLALNEDKKKPPKLTIEAAGVQLAPKPIEGIYPDWRRVVPPADRPNHPMPAIDAMRLAAACEAIALMTHKTSPDTRPLDINAGPIVDGVTFVAIRPAVMILHGVTDCLALIGSIRR